MILGSAILSIEMSEKLRWTEGSYVEESGIVISPEQRNPKKQTRKAAHSMTWSKLLRCDRIR